MAVYQISRIQVRRGQANQGTGIPQLASGEMAWAIDTQELYIGNGAVSEGAPAVGNTKVLTINDLSITSNFLNTIQYIYKSGDPTVTTGPSSTSPVYRSIVDRLDDQASTANFGSAGDGATDDTMALQRAINQVFLNPSSPATAYPSKRVELHIPAGTYNITDTIYVPSYTTLIGAGIDKTIINYTPDTVTVTGSTTGTNAILTTTTAASTMLGYLVVGTGIPANTRVTTVTAGTSLTLSENTTVLQSGATFTLINPKPAFQFVNDSSTDGNIDPSAATGTTQCRKVSFGNLTISTDSGHTTCLTLNTLRDSLFENVKLSGGWSGLPSSNSVGIKLTSISQLVTCENNIFKNIVATGFNYVVYSYQSDILNNVFEDCYFSESLLGFYIGAGGVTLTNPNGPRQTEINNSKFYNIKQQAVYAESGTGTNLNDCSYSNVGNVGNTNTAAQYPQVYFTTYGNATRGDKSDRHSDLSDPNTGTNSTYALVPYTPEVSGHGTYVYNGTRSSTLISVSSFTQLIKLPVPWIVNPIKDPDTHILTSGPTGQITYVVDYLYASTGNAFTRKGTMTISADVINRKIQLSDEYEFAGTDVANTDAIYLDFKAEFLNKLGVATTTDPWTIVISYINDYSGDTGTFNYTYKSIF